MITSLYLKNQCNHQDLNQTVSLIGLGQIIQQFDPSHTWPSGHLE